MLLDKEPRDQLSTPVRQLAMDAIAALRYLPVPPGDPDPEVCVHLHEASRHRSQHQCPTGPPLSLQLSAECDGGQREKPPRSLLQERLLASSERAIRNPAPFHLPLGKGWVSYRSPQSLWAAPGLDLTGDQRQGRGSAWLPHPHPFVPFPWALPAADCLPLGLSPGHRKAGQESSLGARRSGQSPAGERDHGNG